MAEISNMINKNRINLGKAIPLSTPFVIQLETSGFCNLRCRFCPVNHEQTKGRIPHDTLTMDLFKAFVEQCAAFPEKIKWLRIIGVGEPLLNKQIAEMIRYAKNFRGGESPFEKIEITTNGTLLTPELSEELIDAGLDVLKISLEGIDEERFYKVSQVRMDMEKLRENIAYFYNHRKNCILYVKVVEESVPSEEMKKEFMDTYGKISDYIFIENTIENWPGFFAGAKETDVVRYNIEAYQKKKEICIHPFMILCVGANGDVMPCSVDWERKLKLGNIQQQPIADIWNGENLRNLRLGLLNKEKGETCSLCHLSVNNQPDDIDDYADEIRERIAKQ